jgi:H+/gluconate symporter-like permease
MAKDLVQPTGQLVMLIMIFALVIGAIAQVLINSSGVTVPTAYTQLANNTSNDAVSWFTTIRNGAGVVFGLIAVVFIIKLFGGWLNSGGEGKGKRGKSSSDSTMFG